MKKDIVMNKDIISWRFILHIMMYTFLKKTVINHNTLNSQYHSIFEKKKFCKVISIL